jgi:hypothetical protein
MFPFNLKRMNVSDLVVAYINASKAYRIQSVVPLPLIQKAAKCLIDLILIHIHQEDTGYNLAELVSFNGDSSQLAIYDGLRDNILTQIVKSNKNGGNIEKEINERMLSGEYNDSLLWAHYFYVMSKTDNAKLAFDWLKLASIDDLMSGFYTCADTDKKVLKEVVDSVTDAIINTTNDNGFLNRVDATIIGLELDHGFNFNRVS